MGAPLYKFDGLFELCFCAVDLALGVLIGIQFEAGQIDVGLGHLEREECVKCQALFTEVFLKVLDCEACLIAAGAGCEYV